MIYMNFEQLVEQHFAEPLTVGDYAARLYLSQHHLNHVDSRVTGQPTRSVIRARRQLEAERWLTTTSQVLHNARSVPVSCNLCCLARTPWLRCGHQMPNTPCDLRSVQMLR